MKSFDSPKRLIGGMLSGTYALLYLCEFAQVWYALALPQFDSKTLHEKSNLATPGQNWNVSIELWRWSRIIDSTFAFVVPALALPGNRINPMQSATGEVAAGFAALLVLPMLNLLPPFSWRGSYSRPNDALQRAGRTVAGLHGEHNRMSSTCGAPPVEGLSQTRIRHVRVFQLLVRSLSPHDSSVIFYDVIATQSPSIEFIFAS
jgi:hypothetical protein